MAKFEKTEFSDQRFLHQLRRAVPFLQQIPDNIYFNLNTSELYLPSGKIASARESLEQELDNNVMTYNRDIFRLDIPVSKHLCANIAGASLTDQQGAVLDDYEKRFLKKAITFVVYQRPVKLIDPSKSLLSSLYKNQ